MDAGCVDCVVIDMTYCGDGVVDAGCVVGVTVVACIGGVTGFDGEVGSHRARVVCL